MNKTSFLAQDGCLRCCFTIVHHNRSICVGSEYEALHRNNRIPTKMVW